VFTYDFNFLLFGHISYGYSVNKINLLVQSTFESYAFQRRGLVHQHCSDSLRIYKNEVELQL